MRAIHSLVYSDIEFENEVKIQNEEDDDIDLSKPDWLNNLFNNPLE